MKLIIFSIILMIHFTSFSQRKRYEQPEQRKHQIFFSWGGNRASYSKSNIKFKGKDYNFVLYDVAAQDKPKGLHIDYINPLKMTIPQTNFSLGYFINNNYAIVFRIDHMKYVVSQNQNSRISGIIDLPEINNGSSFNGTYDNQALQIENDFLTFEHTDGLNFVNIGISRYDNLPSLLKMKHIELNIDIIGGLEIGLLYPRTNAQLFGRNRYDEFNIAGYGISIHTGLRIRPVKHFYLQANLKGGFIDMNNIRISNNKTDKAMQNFFFFERVIELGGIINL